MTRRLPRSICSFPATPGMGPGRRSPSGPTPSPLGGVPGQIAYGPLNQPAGNSGGGGGSSPWVVGRVGGPTVWNLLNQSWNCQLAPVTQSALATILQTNPDLPGFSSGQYKLPNLGGLSGDDLQQISPH